MWRTRSVFVGLQGNFGHNGSDNRCTCNCYAFDCYNDELYFTTRNTPNMIESWRLTKQVTNEIELKRRSAHVSASNKLIQVSELCLSLALRTVQWVLMLDLLVSGHIDSNAWWQNAAMTGKSTLIANGTFQENINIYRPGLFLCLIRCNPADLCCGIHVRTLTWHRQLMREDKTVLLAYCCEIRSTFRIASCSAVSPRPWTRFTASLHSN